MNKKISIMFLFIIALSASAYSASDFTVTYKGIKDRIYLNETAIFILQITNNMDKTADFLIYPGAVEWDIMTSPAELRQSRIGPKESKEVTILIKANTFFWQNIYGVPIRIRNLATREVITREVLLEVRGEGTEILGEFLPAVQISFSIPAKIDPRNGITIKAHLKNQNRLNISDLRLVVRSQLVTREYETSLLELESKTLDIVLNLDEYLSPQDDLMNLKAIVTHKGKTYEFHARSEEFSIVPYGMISKESDLQKKWLKKTESITLTNEGNVDRDYSYQVRKYFFSTLFMKMSPKPAVHLVEGKPHYVWSGRLGPEGTHQITIIVSYRWLFYLFTIAGLSLILYYLLRSPVIISKSAVIVGKSEGGVSQLNIQLHIKNRSTRVFNSLEIRDKVPNLLMVMSEFSIGTIRPFNILKHSKRGTIIIWKIDELDGFEERIITYKTSAKLPILGEFTLPKAVLKYKKNLAGDERFTQSNKFRMEYS